MSGEWNKPVSVGHPVDSRSPSEQYGKGRACRYCGGGLSIYNPNSFCGACGYAEADRIASITPRPKNKPSTKNAVAPRRKPKRDHGTKVRSDAGCACAKCRGFRLRELVK